MKKILLVLAMGILLVAIGKGLSFTDEHTEILQGKNVQNKAPVEVLAQREEEIASQPIPDKSAVAQINTEQEAEKILQDGDVMALWQTSEQAELVLNESNRLPVDLAGEVYLDFNPAILRNAQVGDSIDIHIPQLGENHIAEVKKVTSHENGDRTVKAKIIGSNALARAIFTVGETSSYARISLPTDTFVMQSEGNHAWIASVTEMIKSHAKRDDGVVADKDVLPSIGVTPGNDPFGT